MELTFEHLANHLRGWLGYFGPADGIRRMSEHWAVTHVLHNRYLESIGCPNLLSMYEEIHSKSLNRRDTRVRPVV